MPDPTVELRARARVGTTLDGKYRLERVLGIGGMATVYAATHRNKKRFAVKVLHAELSVHEPLRTRFMREGYVANTVGHPGAVAVLDDHVADDGAAYLVMELLDGETLDATSDRHGGKLPLRAVLAATDQVLDVLIAADSQGIVHRDIKPANLFLTRSGQVKLLDFGVARLRDAQGTATTHTGLTMGTPAFMAPEQALGRSDEIGGRTDLWAVGATMFALLTARSVHQASSAQEQMVFAATKPARRLEEIDPELPPQAAELIDKALAFELAARWESARTMREALRSVYRELYGADPAPADLESIAIPEEAAPVSRADPEAATLPVSSSSGHEAKADVRVSANPVSLVGTAAQTQPTPQSRLRFAAGVSLLVVGSAIAGAWIATRGAGGGEDTSRDANGAALAASATSTPTPTPIPTPPPTPTPTTATDPSSVASAAASSTATRVILHPLRPKPAGPTATPSANTDRFDRQ